MSIDVAFFAFVAADAEPRVSGTSGKNWVKLRAGVGRDEDLQWVQVAVFGSAADKAIDLKKGDRIYVEGAIKIANWKGSDGADRYGLSVAAFKCERTHNIGRNRKSKKKSDQPPTRPANQDRGWTP